MESQYARLKRSTLKDLLESRGRSASNRPRRELIADLLELDEMDGSMEGTEPLAPVSEEDVITGIVQRRLSLYPETSVELINQLFREAREEIQTKRGQELELVRARQPITHAVPTPPPAATGKKIPFTAFKAFVESEEEIDGYLADFERQCSLHQVPPDQWVTILSGKLSGKANEAFRALAPEDILQYQQVKKALLTRYAVTPEAYRRRFRESKKKAVDSHMEWANRLQRVASLWVQGCKANTGEEVLQLFLMEHFFQDLAADIQDWVRDRRPANLNEAARLADEYTETRKVSQSTTRRAQKVEPRTPTITPRPEFQAPVPPGPPSPQGPNNYPRDSSRMTCHHCSNTGHIARYCPLRATNNNWRRTTPNTEVTPSRPSAAHCLETEGGPEECLGIVYEADPIQAASPDNRQHHRQEVRVNGQVAQGLRDSGTTITLIQKHLVKPENVSTRTVAVRVAGGAVFRVPTARVHLDWGAGSGKTTVGIMDNLPAEVVLGNDIGPLTSAYLPTPAAACPVTTRVAGINSLAAETRVRLPSPTCTVDPAQYHSLKWECDKLASEKSEMQRHYVMYYEMSRGLNIEMHKQAEIVRRLNGICIQVVPYLSQEHQQQVLGAIERAKQVTVPELNSIIHLHHQLPTW